MHLMTEIEDMSSPRRLLVEAVCIAVLLLAGTSAQAAAQISVIVGSSSKHVPTAQQIADIFAGATSTWPDGTKIQIVELDNAETTRQFYDKVVRRPVSMVRAQWQRLALSGQAPAPKRAVDGSGVKDAVRRNPNSIGFIMSDDLDGRVKEVLKVP